MESAGRGRTKEARIKEIQIGREETAKHGLVDKIIHL